VYKWIIIHTNSGDVDCYENAKYKIEGSFITIISEEETAIYPENRIVIIYPTGEY